MSSCGAGIILSLFGIRYNICPWTDASFLYLSIAEHKKTNRTKEAALSLDKRGQCVESMHWVYAILLTRCFQSKVG